MTYSAQENLATWAIGADSNSCRASAGTVASDVPTIAAAE